MGFIGIFLGLGLLIWFAYRGWSVLILCPLAALVAALFSGEPLLATWTQTFMSGTVGFLAQFFPLFLLGALFGKLMDDSGSVQSIAAAMSKKLGVERALLAVVLAGALVTYGGVSLFVAFFVLVPMAQSLFKQADIPRRLMPAAIALGTSTFTMSAMPGTPAIQNAIPMPFFGTTPFAAPGLGLIASLIMFGFGMWWLGLARNKARLAGEGYGLDLAHANEEVAEDARVRDRACTADNFDPGETVRGHHSHEQPSALVAMLPLGVVIVVNLLMALVILPRIDASYLEELRWGSTSLQAVAGVWSVMVALMAGICTLVALNLKRLAQLRDSIGAGASASALPVLSVSSLVGFGSVIAALPAFEIISDWVLSVPGGPLVSLAIATNVLAALTGSASGGLTIALEALADTYMEMAELLGIAPALLHRVAVIGAGTLDMLPHNGAVVTLLALCGCTHKESYFDMVMAAIVSGLIALVVVIILGTMFGSF